MENVFTDISQIDFLGWFKHNGYAPEIICGIAIRVFKCKSYLSKKMTTIENNSPIERGKRVKRLRNLANIDRKTACEFGNFSIPTLKNWELGRYGGINDLGAKKILNVVKNNGVEASYDWLMFGNGTSPTVSIAFEEIKESLDTQRQNTFSVDKEEQQILYELSVFKNHHQNIAYFYISDDSMNPIYQIGDYVAGIKVYPENIKTSKSLNLNCIVELKSGENFVKVLERIKPTNKYCFHSINLDKSLKNDIFQASDIIYIAPIRRHYKKNVCF